MPGPNERDVDADADAQGGGRRGGKNVALERETILHPYRIVYVCAMYCIGATVLFVNARLHIADTIWKGRETGYELISTSLPSSRLRAHSRLTITSRSFTSFACFILSCEPEPEPETEGRKELELPRR